MVVLLYDNVIGSISEIEDSMSSTALSYLTRNGSWPKRCLEQCLLKKNHIERHPTRSIAFERNICIF